MSLLDLLRPEPLEIERLALREADPAHYEKFEPITRGFWFAVGVIVFVGVLAMVLSPFRLLAHLLRGSR
jgi:hypothetical protein